MHIFCQNLKKNGKKNFFRDFETFKTSKKQHFCSKIIKNRNNEDEKSVISTMQNHRENFNFNTNFLSYKIASNISL